MIERMAASSRALARPTRSASVVPAVANWGEYTLRMVTPLLPWHVTAETWMRQRRTGSRNVSDICVKSRSAWVGFSAITVSYTHLRAHETDSYIVCRLLLE